ncbi:MAG: hypothetical protein U5L96_03920 [Owenweeksia sp.]|nr:hypothetical protein [Owenweeksia sp.]
MGLPHLSKAQDYNSPVQYLHSNLERKRFLISVYHLYQSVRDYEDSVMIASGWKSEPHLTSIDSLYEVDSILIRKIDQYLDHYKYPDRKGFEEVPRITPWLVLNHSRNAQIRQKHFPVLYQAYQEGNLEERRLLKFLEDEYERQFERNFQSYAVEEARVGELMQVLELMPARGRKLFRSQR